MIPHWLPCLTQINKCGSLWTVSCFVTTWGLSPGRGRCDPQLSPHGELSGVRWTSPPPTGAAELNPSVFVLLTPPETLETLQFTGRSIREARASVLVFYHWLAEARIPFFSPSSSSKPKDTKLQSSKPKWHSWWGIFSIIIIIIMIFLIVQLLTESNSLPASMSPRATTAYPHLLGSC